VTDAQVSESSLVILPQPLQLTGIQSIHAMVQPDASRRNIEARSPDDNVELVARAAVGDEAGGSDSGDGIGGEMDVGTVESFKPAGVVGDSLAVHGCWGEGELRTEDGKRRRNTR